MKTFFTALLVFFGSLFCLFVIQLVTARGRATGLGLLRAQVVPLCIELAALYLILSGVLWYVTRRLP